jgi:aryl-alcohol dehydrogenase-like predicted oxidoreductase
MPWSPLAGGFLTGKYERDDTADTGRLSGTNPFGNSKFSDRNWEVLAALKEVAAEQDRTPAQIVLAWVMAQRGVASTLIGARSVSQLNGNIAATQVMLTSDQMNRLGQISAPAEGFSASLTTSMIRQMVYGGHDVTGWIG